MSTMALQLVGRGISKKVAICFSLGAFLCTSLSQWLSFLITTLLQGFGVEKNEDVVNFPDDDENYTVNLTSLCKFWKTFVFSTSLSIPLPICH